MDRPNLPLNALRAFEAAARHLTLTHAAVELCVTQAALSHQIRNLEDRLGVALFRRVPRGLVLTEEGVALAPVVTAALDSIGETLDRFSGGRFHEALNLGVVGTFAIGWLIPRLPEFEAAHPEVDLRIFTNNNRVTITAVNIDVTKPMLKVTAKPLIGPVPNPKSTSATSSVVILASKIVEKAFS